MYTDFWGLRKPPFDNVPDPTMYVDSHVSVENTIAETLFAIEEGNECLTVVVGDVGLGKTMSLRMILDSLDHEKYKIAFVTNPDMSFVQLLKEIIGQLMGKECEIRGKIELLEVFNKLLFETADEKKKVLIFIDEANAISPANLESLRLLTNMQDDDKNLFTIVLAGQLEFAKRLEHPSRANLYQRIGTYNKIEKMENEEVVKKYVETRMKLAGATRKVFADDAIHMLWEYSEHGVPRLINKIAKLCLKAGETNDFQMITSEVVQQIGERFDKMTGPAVQKRRITDSRASQTPKKETIKAKPEKEDTQKVMAVEKEKVPVLWPSPPPPPPPPTFQKVSEPEIVPPPPRVEPFPSRLEIPQEKPFFKKVEEKEFKEKHEEPIIEKAAPPPPLPPPKAAPEPEIVPPLPRIEPFPSRPEILQEKPFNKVEEKEVEEKRFKEELKEIFKEPIIEKAEPPTPTLPPPVESIFKPVEEIVPEAKTILHPPKEEAIEAEVDREKEVEEKRFKEELKEIFKEPIIEKAEPPTPTLPPPVESIFKPVEEIVPEAKTVLHPPKEEAIEAEKDRDLVTIAGCKIKIEIPPHILEQAQLANSEQKKKIAGVLAAQTLEKNPQLTALPTVDPVSVWSDILNAIMNKLG
jgi:type II secretory pathway predicted ATPase ExeA